jgi:hypothetical protein
MRTALWLVAAAVGGGMVFGAAAHAGRARQDVPPAATHEIAGIHWEESLDAAKIRAAREGKPIFLLHLMGRLDDEFC